MHSIETRFKTNPKPLDKCFFGLEQVQTSLIDLLIVSFDLPKTFPEILITVS